MYRVGWREDCACEKSEWRYKIGLFTLRVSATQLTVIRFFPFILLFSSLPKYEAPFFFFFFFSLSWSSFPFSFFPFSPAPQRYAKGAEVCSNKITMPLSSSLLLSALSTFLHIFPIQAVHLMRPPVFLCHNFSMQPNTTCAC